MWLLEQTTRLIDRHIRPASYVHVLPRMALHRVLYESILNNTNFCKSNLTHIHVHDSNSGFTSRSRVQDVCCPRALNFRRSSDLHLFFLTTGEEVPNHTAIVLTKDTSRVAT